MVELSLTRQLSALESEMSTTLGKGKALDICGCIRHRFNDLRGWGGYAHVLTLVRYSPISPIAIYQHTFLCPKSVVVFKKLVVRAHSAPAYCCQLVGTLH